jgi:hypothetical protein
MTYLCKSFQTKFHIECHLLPLSNTGKDIYIYKGGEKSQVSQIKVEKKMLLG